MKEKRSGILGIGKKLGSKVLTNPDLEKMVDTSDEWIRTRTGIIERHIVEEGETTVTLATAASQEAIKEAGIDPEDIGLVIVTTITPEQPLPATASFVQEEIGAVNAGAFDLVVACPGFVYGVSIADSLIKTDMCKYILVISCDILSHITNWDDRTTCVLFADGAGAAVIGEIESSRGFLATALHNRPFSELLEIPAGGVRKPITPELLEKKENKVIMRGNELFKVAVKAMSDVSKEVLEKADYSIEQVDHLVPHQANIRITDAVANRLKIDPEKAFTNIQYMGNNSSATIPASLYDLAKSGKLKKGDVVLSPSFGAGVSYGAFLIIW